MEWRKERSDWLNDNVHKRVVEGDDIIDTSGQMIMNRYYWQILLTLILPVVLLTDTVDVTIDSYCPTISWNIYCYWHILTWIINMIILLLLLNRNFSVVSDRSFIQCHLLMSMFDVMTNRSAVMYPLKVLHLTVVLPVILWMLYLSKDLLKGIGWGYLWHQRPTLSLMCRMKIPLLLNSDGFLSIDSVQRWSKSWIKNKVQEFYTDSDVS